MIPQDNATGNFVKVEQRIPVRISLYIHINRSSRINAIPPIIWFNAPKYTPPESWKVKGNKPEDLKRLRAGFNVECEVKY